MKVPSKLNAGQMEFSVIHRLYGEAFDEPFDHFFGLQMGANVGLGLRGHVTKNIELYSLYIISNEEFSIGGGYVLPISKNALFAQFQFRYCIFTTWPDKRESTFFGLLSFQTHFGGNRINPVLNIGYDSYFDEMGLGVGCDLHITKKFSLVGEIYPKLQSKENVSNSFAFGIKVTTYGHHFMILLGNNTQIGQRHLMYGTDNSNLHVGFVIHRLFEL